MVIQRRTGWTAQIASRAVAAALCCVALIAASCSGDEGLKSGDAASVAPDSTVQVADGDGEWTTYQAGDVIAEGAQVRADGDEGRLTFRAGSARLAPGAVVTVATDTVTLNRGEVLVDADGGLAVVNADTRIAGSGVVRVSTGLAARVAVYRGVAVVERPSQNREIPALRQLDLAAFRLAAQGTPLRYREGDAWDRDLLADAIAFDGEAARLARGIDVEFGTGPQLPRFYAEFTQRRALTLLRRTAPVVKGERFGPPSDVLLTAFVAGAATPKATLREGISSVADLRAAGARWGLIAMELDVRSDAVVAAIDTLDSDELALADRPPSGSANDAPGDAGGSAGGDADGGSAPSGDVTPPTGGSDDPAPRDPGGDDDDDDDGDGGGGEDPGPLPPTQPEDPEGAVEEVVSEVLDTVPDDDDDDKAGSGAPKLPDLPPLPEVDLPLIK